MVHLQELLVTFFFLSLRGKKNIYKTGYCFLNFHFLEKLSLFTFSSSLSSFLVSRAIVLRYGVELYLVQSPLGNSWGWKDSSSSDFWNGIIRTISRRNPFRYIYSLFHHEPNFILSSTLVSISFWGSAVHVMFVQNDGFLLSTLVYFQQHGQKTIIKIKFYFLLIWLF